MKINRVRFDISVGRNKPENILNKENAWFLWMGSMGLQMRI